MTSSTLIEYKYFWNRSILLIDGTLMSTITPLSPEL